MRSDPRWPITLVLLATLTGCAGNRGGSPVLVQDERRPGLVSEDEMRAHNRLPPPRRIGYADLSAELAELECRLETRDGRVLLARSVTVAADSISYQSLATARFEALPTDGLAAIAAYSPRRSRGLGAMKGAFAGMSAGAFLGFIAFSEDEDLRVPLSFMAGVAGAGVGILIGAVAGAPEGTTRYLFHPYEKGSGQKAAPGE